MVASIRMLPWASKLYYVAKVSLKVMVLAFEVDILMELSVVLTKRSVEMKEVAYLINPTV